MPTWETTLLTLVKLQRSNARDLLAFDDLACADRLPQALEAGEHLCSALQQQNALTEALNRLAPAGAEPQMSAMSIWLDVRLRTADLAQSLGQHERAAAWREQAMAQAAALGGVDHAERQRQMAGSLMEAGRFHEALTGLLAAHRQFEALGAVQGQRACEADLAEAHEWLGDDERALEFAEKAVRTLAVPDQAQAPSTGMSIEAVRLRLERLMTQIQMAMAASDLTQLAQCGDQMQALKAQQEVVALQTKVWSIQARCLVRRHEFEPAQALFMRVRSLVPAHARPAIDFQGIKVQVEDRQYAQALSAIERLRPQFESPDSALHRKLPVVLTLQAKALLGLGQLESVQAVLQVARQGLSTQADPDMTWRLLDVLAQVQAAQGDLAAALATSDEAVRVIDWLRRAPLGERLDSLRLVPMLPVFERGLRWAVELNDALTCAHYIEMIKSRQLAATLAVPGGSGGDSGLSRDIDELTRQLAQGEYQGASVEVIEALAVRRRVLLEQQRIEDPRWRVLSEPPPIDLPHGLQVLQRRGQALVTLHFDGQACTAVLLHDGTATVSVQTVPEETCRRLDQFLSNLVAPTPDLALYDPAASGLTADTWLAASLLRQATTAESLVVVPHGRLHLLPWGALWFEGAPLFMRLPVLQLPNVGAYLHSVRDVGTDPEPALGVAILASSPATWSGKRQWQKIQVAEEAQVVAERYAEAGHPVIGPLLAPSATRDACLGLLHGPRRPRMVLHLACHGQFVVADPVASHLVLDDGPLDVAAIMSKRIAFDEVVLGSCSAGHRAVSSGGVDLIGDEVVGLTGAFMEAGARELLVSMTPVADEATQHLMGLYHQARLQGLPPRHALRTAQMALWDDRDFYPLCNWCGFVIHGGA